LWVCGDNSSGQLGNKSNDNINYPEKMLNGVSNISANAHSLILKDDGSLWACGLNNCGQLGDGTTENKSTPVRIIPKSTAP
jgi:alpha-tubulin suppressor-like RCC1 family protein